MTRSSKNVLIPAVLFSFALISLITLKSIEPTLASVQLIFWILSLSVFFISSRLNIHLIKRYHWLGYIGLNVLLIITLINGTITRGTARWIRFGDLFAIQPSQLAVPLVGLSLALFAKEKKLNSIKHIVQFLVLLMIPSVLILVEPDLGTTIHLLLSMGIILFLSEIKMKYIWSLVGVGVVSILVAWMFVLQPYQKSRITSFINAQNNQQASTNYNAFQSQIAVGSGGVLGKGLGQGSQSSLRFLPERQTDFIFASFSEEWGFIGAMILLILYSVLNAFLIIRALVATDKFQFYLIITTVTAITIQVFVNIGMNIGLLPITGVTLPFVSYGGSSLISLCLLLGINQNIILNQKKKLKLDIT